MFGLRMTFAGIGVIGLGVAVVMYYRVAREYSQEITQWKSEQPVREDYHSSKRFERAKRSHKWSKPDDFGLMLFPSFGVGIVGLGLLWIAVAGGANSRQGSISSHSSTSHGQTHRSVSPTPMSTGTGMLGGATGGSGSSGSSGSTGSVGGM